MTASPSACNTSNNTYSVTGVITVTAPPSTGNLTITNSCGGTPITMTPPFSTSIPYSFTGLNSNGAGCVVTAGFSADPTCTFAVNYTAPASCSIACSMTTSATQVQSVSCNGGNNGSASVTISGGTSPYSYTWSPTGGNSSTASGLTAGVYTVTVKDANNCTATSTVQITQSSAYTLAMTTQSASCSTLGSATINVSGGAGSYNYTWSPTGGNSNVATGLSSGSYTVSIKDANNCYTTSVANITGAPTVSITSVNVNSVMCNGGSSGSATVNVSGGAVPYNYTWTPSVSSSSVASGLSAGTYSVTVKDNNNCVTNTVITISQPPALSLTATQVQSVSCNGGNNGAANASVSGGMPAYSYTWLPTGGNSSTASGLTAGIYTVNVQDANNCAISGTVQITQPPALSLTATQVQSVSCSGGNNGAANASVSGGLSPYTYTWSPMGGNSSTASGLTAGIYTINVQDVNNCSISATVQIQQPPALSLSINTQSASCSTPGSATANVSGGVGGYSYTWMPSGGNSSIATGLGAGNYTVVIQDMNGCSISGVVNITGAPMVSISSVNVNSVLCNGGSNGSATVNVSGGVSPYNYTWTPSVSSSSIATGLGSGTYSVLVMDNNNCTASTIVTITQPPALSLTATQTQSVSCNGGNNGVASSTVSGGVGGYTYTWMPSGGNSSIASNLTQGIYTITVSDANNCGPISATVQIVEPPALSLTATQVQSVSCNGGNNGVATSTASGGVGGYTYTWTPSGGNSSTANNLTQGIYTVAISDGNNCGPISSTVQIVEPPALSISVSGQSVSCYGYSDGSASVSVSGGVGGYSYTWSPSGGNGSVASNLVAGVYTVDVRDVNNCYITGSINIPQPSSISLITSPNQTICYGNSTNISAMASGGNPPYNYNWNPNISGNGGPVMVSPTVTSQYQVSVSDANGCTGPSSVIIVYVKPPLVVSGFTTNVCDGQSVVLYPTVVSPGNGGGYVYTWSNSSSSSSITVIGNSALGSVNVYSVIVDDGCSSPPGVAMFTVNIYPNPVISYSTDVRKGCVPVYSNFTAISNSVSITSYTWIFGNGEESNSNPAMASYTGVGVYSPTLIVESQYGCRTETVLTNYIESYPYPVADFTVDSWTVSVYEPLVNFINLSVGGTNYQWDFGDPVSGILNNSNEVNPSHEYLYSGDYIVSLMVKNEYGCVDYIAKKIYVDMVFNIYIPNVFTPDGNGINDIFQPKGIGIDESDYKMLIFDRWGEIVFESNNFQKGWDGSIKGDINKVKEDVYVYKIYARDLKGNRHEYVGHVTCLPYTKE